MDLDLLNLLPEPMQRIESKFLELMGVGVQSVIMIEPEMEKVHW